MSFQAQQQLPEHYVPFWSLDLSKSPAAVIALNAAGLPLFVGFYWLFNVTARILHPGLIGEPTIIHSVGIIVLRPFSLLASSILMVVLHEAIHGVFFWLSTKERPVFGFKWLYAYAGAPGWFIPRNPYLVIGLAPFVVLSCAGVIAQPFVPLSFLFTMNFTLALNAAGAAGDLYVVLKLLTYPPSIYVNDTGDNFTAYGEEEEQR